MVISEKLVGSDDAKPHSSTSCNSASAISCRCHTHTKKTEKYLKFWKIKPINICNGNNYFPKIQHFWVKGKR